MRWTEGEGELEDQGEGGGRVSRVWADVRDGRGGETRGSRGGRRRASQEWAGWKRRGGLVRYEGEGKLEGRG